MDTIIDCYTDEPSGLGVPPYLGTYPRYLYGYLNGANYLTIDDLRYFFDFILENKRYDIQKTPKTSIKIYNLTKNVSKINEIITNTSDLYIVLGVHTPGKYLSASPGTIREIGSYLAKIKKLNPKVKIILTGPAIYGTQLEGGKFSEKIDDKIFDETFDFNPRYSEIKKYASKGMELIGQIPSLRIIELETGHGCNYGRCSFCTEPLKNKLEFREEEDILEEITSFYEKGIYHFRLGKQSDIYSYPSIIDLLKKIKSNFPKIKVLHIDNVNPVSVLKEKGKKITETIVECCTEGNIAAFGVESFDEDVVEENCLNSDPENSYEAVKILNEYGKEPGTNGMPKFLPGINLLYGLKGESKKTHEKNFYWLKRMLEENLLLRRINIRQVSIFEGTPLWKGCKNKFLKKNGKYYWKWSNEIRQKIDYPMLNKVVPVGTILKDVRMEIYDGNTTFGRQIGSYPLIVGVAGRHELGKFYSIKVKSHMLRSIVGELV